MNDKQWSDAKTDYVTTNLSYRQISEKYGIAFGSLTKRGADEHWRDARKSFRKKAEKKKEDLALKREAGRYERMISLADKLADKLERAIDELEKQIITQSTRTRTIEYNNMQRPDKPTKEVITDEQKIETVESLVSREGLRQLAAALKDIRDVQGLRSDADTREQEARIKKLEKDAEEQKQESASIEFDGIPEAWREA